MTTPSRARRRAATVGLALAMLATVACTSNSAVIGTGRA